MLNSELGDKIQFIVPEGGMTVWVEFNVSINLEKISKKAYESDLYISDGKMHKYPSYNANAIRLGFASSDKEKLYESVLILKNLLLE